MNGCAVGGGKQMFVLSRRIDRTGGELDGRKCFNGDWPPSAGIGPASTPVWGAKTLRAGGSEGMLSNGEDSGNSTLVPLTP